MQDCPVLYIVVPCYQEQDTLPATNERLLGLLDRLTSQSQVHTASRILYVDDGSTDDTWPIISDLAARHAQVCGMTLSANVGHQNALVAGLECAADLSDCTITIDADLQDDINVIPQMLDQYAAGTDVVYGVRRERKSDTWFKRNSAQAFHRLMHALDVKSVYNHADYRLMSRRAVKALLAFKERNLFLRGLVPLVGYRSSEVYYDRIARQAGKSKYPPGKMLSFAIDGITSFSVKPVRLVLTLGIVFVLVAAGMLVYALVSYFTGHAISGWASLILSLWFIGGCILIGLGIVGEYIGKIYIEVKGRPRYFVQDSIIH